MTAEMWIVIGVIVLPLALVFGGRWRADLTGLFMIRRLIRLPRQHPVFRRRRWFQGRPILGSGREDIVWLTRRGMPMTEDDCRHLGWHSESGSYHSERWLEIYAAHAHGHAGQIERLKAALAG